MIPKSLNPSIYIFLKLFFEIPQWVGHSRRDSMCSHPYISSFHTLVYSPARKSYIYKSIIY